MIPGSKYVVEMGGVGVKWYCNAHAVYLRNPQEVYDLEAKEIKVACSTCWIEEDVQLGDVAWKPKVAGLLTTSEEAKFSCVYCHKPFMLFNQLVAHVRNDCPDSPSNHCHFDGCLRTGVETTCEECEHHFCMEHSYYPGSKGLCYGCYDTNRIYP